MGIKVVFSSILSAAGKDTERSRKIHTYMAESWYNHKNFGFFFDHKAVYSAPGLMSADGSRLSQRGKQILAQNWQGSLRGT